MLENKNKQRKEINLIPLVNIIFLLLTFFMVAGTIEKVDPFPLNLPDSSRKNTGTPARVSVVYIHKDGRIAVNNDFVARKDLFTIVNTLQMDNKDREIIIKADSDVAAKDLIWVMRTIESAGNLNVSIITKVVK